MRELVLIRLAVAAVVAFSASNAFAYRVLQGNYMWLTGVGNEATGTAGPAPTGGDIEAVMTAIPYNASSTLGDGNLADGGKTVVWDNVGPYNDRWAMVNIDLGHVVEIDRITTVHDNIPVPPATPWTSNEWGMNQHRIKISADGVTWYDANNSWRYSSTSGQFYTRTAETFSTLDTVNARYVHFAMGKDHGETALLSEIVIDAVPEPATMMLLLGGSLFGLLRRRS